MFIAYAGRFERTVSAIVTNSIESLSHSSQLYMLFQNWSHVLRMYRLRITFQIRRRQPKERNFLGRPLNTGTRP
jgi:hypothetical protein